MAKRKRRPRSRPVSTDRPTRTRPPASRKQTGSERRTAPSRPAPSARPGGSRRLLVIGAAGVLLIGGYYLWQWHQARRPAPPPRVLSPAPSLTQPADLPRIQTGPPPWGIAAPELRARLETIGLPVLPAEVTNLHIHVHLDVLVQGKPVTVPANVGINAAGGYLSPLHTHDDTRLIHVESPTNREFTLGEFF